MTRNCCLMLIDLQNEFLSPSTGRFLIHESSRPFLDNLPGLTAVFRTSGQPIVWVRAQYGNPDIPFLPDGEQQWDAKSVQAGTHRGKIPCCEKDSIGAEFTEDIASLISGGSDSENIIITKSWYSAFKDTNLLAELRNRDIKEILLTGLLTNICVMATALDAVDLGFDVTVLQDCMGWRRIASHDRALKTMLKHGIRVASSSDIDISEGISIPTPNLPRLYYVNGSIPSWRIMMVLYEKDIKFNPIRLLVMSHPKETRMPDFLALNHRGKTPVFVDVPLSSDSVAKSDPDAQHETVTINESIAILHYIETYHNPSKPLLPAISQRTSRALSLARIQESEILHNLYDALEDAHFEAERSGTKLDDAGRVQLIKAVDHELDFWEVYAEKTAFIAGDEFGLADCAFFPLLAYMVHRGFEWQRTDFGLSTDLEGYGDWPHLQAYFRRVWERDGESGCAQMAQPIGWGRKGKANIWKGTRKC